MYSIQFPLIHFNHNNDKTDHWQQIGQTWSTYFLHGSTWQTESATVLLFPCCMYRVQRKSVFCFPHLSSLAFVIKSNYIFDLLSSPLSLPNILEKKPYINYRRDNDLFMHLIPFLKRTFIWLPCGSQSTWTPPSVQIQYSAIVDWFVPCAISWHDNLQLWEFHNAAGRPNWVVLIPEWHLWERFNTPNYWIAYLFPSNNSENKGISVFPSASQRYFCYLMVLRFNILSSVTSENINLMCLFSYSPTL